MIGNDEMYEAYLKIVAKEDELPDDLYGWAIERAASCADLAKAGVKEEMSYWSAWFAARKVAWVLLNKMRGLEGEEITPEMIEEFRALCAELAYD